MKHVWRIRRQTSPKLDGQQRWDRAYQLLLQWSQTNLTLSTHPTLNPTQEVLCDHQGRCLRQGFNLEPGTRPDD